MLAYLAIESLVCVGLVAAVIWELTEPRGDSSVNDAIRIPPDLRILVIILIIMTAAAATGQLSSAIIMLLACLSRLNTSINSRQEGLAGLYGGRTPHIMRAIPSSIITLGMYEFVLRLVVSQSKRRRIISL